MRKAFTLVELLVVIAIISLLISILAPSLNIAKDIAKQVVCSQNMNSAAKGIMLYCQQNDDKYPPWRSLIKSGQPYAEPMGDATRTMQIAKVGDLDPMTLKLRWRGAGVVYGERYFETPRLFYCPAQVYSWFVYEEYVINHKAGDVTVEFGSWDNWSSVIRSGYFWNAWGKKYPGGRVDINGRTYDFAFRTLSSMENDKPLIIDHAIYPWCVPVHVATGVATPSLNVAFNDGHVTGYTAPDMYLTVLITNWGGNGIASNWDDNPGDNNDWADAYRLLTQGG